MNIQVFEKDGFHIRVAGDNENPLFVAKDVCQALGIENASKAISDLKKKEDGVTSSYPIVDRLGREQKVTMLTEQGLYLLIMQSRKPEAVKFQLWVTGEVLPSIRKTGGYSIKQMTPAELLLEQAKLTVALEKKVDKVATDVKQLKDEVAAIEVNKTVLPKSGYASIGTIADQAGVSGSFVRWLIDNGKVKVKTGTAIKQLPDGSTKPYTTYKVKPILKFIKKVKQTAKPIGKGVYFRSPLTGGKKFQYRGDTPA